MTAHTNITFNLLDNLFGLIQKHINNPYSMAQTHTKITCAIVSVIHHHLSIHIQLHIRIFPVGYSDSSYL